MKCNLKIRLSQSLETRVCRGLGGQAAFKGVFKEPAYLYWAVSGFSSPKFCVEVILITERSQCCLLLKELSHQVSQEGKGSKNPATETFCSQPKLWQKIQTKNYGVWTLGTLTFSMYAQM